MGRALLPFLAARGHSVIPLHRAGHTPTSQPTWNWETESLDLRGAGPFDAVIHLAGETIAQRWTAERKARIYHSRVNGTRFLAAKIATRPQLPRVMLSASAIGIYGDRGAELLDEQSEAGTGFLAGVCREWESATRPAAEAGIRVAHLRFGIVLAPQGGALGKMLPAFRMGLGGRIGDGTQFWSWITLDDVLQAIEFLLNEPVSGPVNLVAPNPVPNREFTEALGKALRRPTVFSIPRTAINLLFGEMGRESMLASTRVRPGRLDKAGFAFRHPELEPALKTPLERYSGALGLRVRGASVPAGQARNPGAA